MMNPFKLTVKRLDGTTHYDAEFATEAEMLKLISDAESMPRPFGFVKQGEYATLPKGAEQYVEEIRSRVIVEGQPARIDLFVDDEGNQVITEIPAVEEETELYTVYIVPKQYTIETEDITAQVEEELEVERLIKLGKNDEDCCRDVLRLVGGINRHKVLSTEQITQMIETYTDAKLMLNDNRPTTAKSIIETIPTDEVILTESDKTRILNRFAKYGI